MYSDKLANIHYSERLELESYKTRDGAKGVSPGSCFSSAFGEAWCNRIAK